MKRLSLVVSLLMGVAFFVQAPAAIASSAYDDAYETVPSLVVSNGGTSCLATDVSYTWKSYITDTTSWEHGPTDSAMINIKTQFEDALDVGSISVSQFTSGWDPDSNSVIILFSPDSELELSWSLSQVSAHAPQGTLYMVTLSCISGSSVHAEYTITNNLPAGKIPANNAMPVSEKADGMAIFDEIKNFIYTGDPNYPAGYEGVDIQTDVPKAEYVALGDSFSSGEGNPKFEPGTNIPGENVCHRSLAAYPRQLQSQISAKSTAFVACSGATTDDILNGKNNEPSQLDSLSSKTDFVTITVGGNDIEFKAFAEACFWNSCSQTSDEYKTSWEIMTDNTNADYLPNSLNEVYEEIADRLGSTNASAKVFVIGYPHVSTYQDWIDEPLTSDLNCPYLNIAEAHAIEMLTDQLNATISDAVDTLGDSRFVFIDPTDPLISEFPEHTMCTSSNWFVLPGWPQDEAYTFHPDSDGMQEYMNIIRDAL